ncbi:MAG: AraC family transcriptional regulator [Bacteroidaceae bacterium]|nr:AraC family transcriptional regulator [Bacteroidaceae bacterium]
MCDKGDKDTSARLLHQLSDVIDERGTVFVDFSSSLIVSNEEYISPYSVVALCHSGYVRSEYDLRPVEFRSHDIAVMRPGHIIKNIDMSDDYRAELIVTPVSYLNTMRRQYMDHHLATHMSFDTHPCQHLNEEQYRQVCDAFGLVRTACNVDGVYRDELISSAFHTLMVLLSTYRYEQLESLQDNGRQLSSRFNEALIEHYRESREIGFYARMFNLSPKYFSTLIKQETGYGAGEWIDRYVVLQAKALLRRMRSLSIQEITDRLGFSEQASFSRFFKRNTGISPKEYREKINSNK